MSNSLRTLRGRRILASDGLAGALNDLYFDERRWLVRYLAIDDTERRPGKRVLVRASLARLEQDGTGQDSIPVQLTGERIRRSGNVHNEPHLLSGREMAGYRVHASDGWIGQVEDLRVGPEWSIVALVVSTRDWLLPGWTVEVPARAVDAIDRTQRLVHVRLTRHEVRGLPHVLEP
jgi:hypothetical protein